MNNCYADPAAQNWKKNKSHKRANDERLLQLIASFTASKKSINVLSFPASGWCFESELSKRTAASVRFTGIEQDDLVFGKAAATAKKLQKSFPNNWYSMHNTTSKQFFKRTPARYDIVYLDWMGTWSKEKRDEITTIFERKILSPRSLLLFTIWECRGNGREMDVLDSLVRKSSIDFPFEDHVTSKMTPNMFRKTYGVAERIIRIAKKEGYEATLANFSEYKGNSNHPQLSFAFKLKTKSN